MNTHDIELPAEFRSGNDIPVTQATIKRERMEEIIRAAIATYQQGGNAKQRYDEMMKDDTEEPDPIEDLRFFCSLAMRQQDWLDVEPFFDALIADRKSRGEPVKSTCKKCNGTGVESTRFHGVWPNGEECLEPIKCDQCDGFGTTSAAEPVKVPSVELQGLADRAYCQYLEQMRRPECKGVEYKLENHKFGVFELAAHNKAYEHLGRYKAFSEAAALLARYGQQAQPTSCQNESMGEHACSDRSQCWEPCGDLGKSEEHARVYDPPVTEQEEEEWRRMEANRD